MYHRASAGPLNFRKYIAVTQEEVDGLAVEIVNKILGSWMSYFVDSLLMRITDSQIKG
jgi:hypothetical protein